MSMQIVQHIFDKWYYLRITFFLGLITISRDPFCGFAYVPLLHNCYFELIFFLL